MANFCAQERLTLEDAQVRNELAENLYSKYEKLQDKIDEQVAEQEIDAENLYRVSIEDSFLAIRSAFCRLQHNSADQQSQQNAKNGGMGAVLESLVQNQNSMSTLLERFSSQIHVGNASTPNENLVRTHEIRLPPVNLPDFSGNILEWVRFKQLFETLLHERTNISDIEKFEYLNTKLRGEALSTIKHLKPTAANYTVGWQLLKQKYGKDDNIKSAYMELLFNQPVIKFATLSEIKKFYSNINEAYSALKSVDESTEQGSSVLLFNIEKKLDVDTATFWFREKRKKDSVKFSDLLNFLEDRMFELENLAGRTTANKEKKQYVSTFVSTSQVCAVCEKDHYIHTCDKFLNMSIDQRRDVIKKLNPCFNCLRNNHKYSECRARSCKKCGKKHNSLLHFSAQQQQQLSHSTQKSDQHESTSSERDDSIDVKHVSTNISQKSERSLVILPTAIVTVLNNHNSSFKCKALLDSALRCSLGTHSFQFGLPPPGGSVTRCRYNAPSCIV